MISSGVDFTFNTAITPIGDDGAFDESWHRTLIMPVRARIMQIDGMTGCNIDRYAMRVLYLPSVVDRETVIRLVQEAVFAVANEPMTSSFLATSVRLFPLRGDKELVVKAVEPVRIMANPNCQRVVARFSASVVPFPVSSTQEGWCEETFRAEVYELARQLTALNGVIGYELRLFSLSLDFDPRYVTREAVERHIHLTLLDAVGRPTRTSLGGENMYFASALQQDGPLMVTFEPMAPTE